MSALPVSREEWARVRGEAMASFTGQVTPDGVLLDYQKRIVAEITAHRVVMVEKSRRIGATWGVGAQAVLFSGARKSAGGMDSYYIGYNLDMAREFIDVCGMWAKAFGQAAGEMEEFLFREQEKDGGERHIKAFRIAFDSGYEIVALSSRPRSLRGKQGFVIIDEAAFHDDLAELLKAAMALLMWGGKVLVISTHDGDENPFNVLIQETRAGKWPYRIIRVTFDEALQDGLYQRICLVTGATWSPAAEAAWRAEIRAFYGDAQGEELDAIPRSGGAIPIPSSIVRARVAPGVPVLRWRRERDWAMQPEAVRKAQCDDFIRGELRPHLDRLARSERPFAVGMDFALVQDLSVIWPAEVGRDMQLRTPFLIELRTIPYQQQKTILFTLLEALARKRGVAIDAKGNGSILAQETAQKFGACVHQVQLQEPWYREHMPRMKRHFDEGTLTVPQDDDTISDFPVLRMVRGVIRVPEKRVAGSDGGVRHGDAAIACALMCFAAEQEEESYDYRSARRPDPGAAGSAIEEDWADRLREGLRTEKGRFAEELRGL